MKEFYELVTGKDFILEYYQTNNIVLDLADSYTCAIDGNKISSEELETLVESLKKIHHYDTKIKLTVEYKNH